MTYLPVYLRVGTGEAWLGDLELPDLEPATVESALPAFLRRAADQAGGIALDHERD